MAVRRPAPPAAEADARQAYLRAISTFPRLTVEEKREVMRLRYDFCLPTCVFWILSSEFCL